MARQWIDNETNCFQIYCYIQTLQYISKNLITKVISTANFKNCTSTSLTNFLKNAS